MDKLISVIVPIYNIDKYLKQCIASIIEQRYRKIEIILVNDGSTDGSDKICDYYSKIDNRIKVIHKSHEGLVQARKTGLENAKGQYIAYVDGDDWIDTNLYEQMIQYVNEYDVDIVLTGCIRNSENKTEIIENKIGEGIYQEDDLIKKIFPYMLAYHNNNENHKYEFGTQQYLWNKLFKKEILYGCQMTVDPDIECGEDVACLYPLMLKAKSIYIHQGAYYHYRFRKDSMTTNANDKYFDNLKILNDYLIKQFTASKHKLLMLSQLQEYIKYMISLGAKKVFQVEMGNRKDYIFPFQVVQKDSKIVIYAAGEVGQAYYYQVTKTNYCNVVGWVDQDYEKYEKLGLHVTTPTSVISLKYDYIIIAVVNSNLAEIIRKDLSKSIVDDYKIIWHSPFGLEQCKEIKYAGLL